MNKWIGVLMVLGFAASYAKVLPLLQYDEAQAILTLPIYISLKDSDITQMARNIALSLGDKEVEVVFKGYLPEQNDLRSRNHTLYVLQKLQRHLDRSLPGLQISTSLVEIVPQQNQLPAWRLSTAGMTPSAYIAVVIIPVDNI